MQGHFASVLGAVMCTETRFREARCGLIVNVTPLEPEWEGYVTLEISNTTPLPAKVYANEGLCQFLFLKGEGPCEVSYADRKGKYMKQTGVTLPKL
jgi:dCTP deaminase